MGQTKRNPRSRTQAERDALEAELLADLDRRLERNTATEIAISTNALKNNGFVAANDGIEATGRAIGVAMRALRDRGPGECRGIEIEPRPQPGKYWVRRTAESADE